MSRENQTNLFLNLDHYIGILFSDVKDIELPYDMRKFAIAILRTEATELLISRPDIPPITFYGVIKALFEKLNHYKKCQVILKLTLSGEEAKPVLLTYHQEKISFFIKPLNYYLLQEEGESQEDRQRRIENYIDQFVLNFSTGELFLREPKYMVQSTFIQHLKHLTATHYFLSDHDLDKFIEWMCVEYTNRSGLFADLPGDHKDYYIVKLITREVYFQPFENQNSQK